MKRTIAATAVFLLTGCVGTASLIDKDGKRYAMDVGDASRNLSTEIDGVKYKGKFIVATGIGFGFGGRPAFGIGQGNSGQAMLTGDNGDMLNCQFMKHGGTMMGQCHNLQGREYALTSE